MCVPVINHNRSSVSIPTIWRAVSQVGSPKGAVSQRDRHRSKQIIHLAAVVLAVDDEFPACPVDVEVFVFTGLDDAVFH